MEFVWDAIKDSLILFPFLLGAYILIELLEAWTSKKFNIQILKSPYAPIFGAGFGLLPQCGFSVIATDLYSNKKITMGTLLAIFIATSDEAIPILIISPNKIAYLLPLLLIKFLFGMAIGFAVDGIIKATKKNKLRKQNINKSYEFENNNDQNKENENNITTNSNENKLNLKEAKNCSTTSDTLETTNDIEAIEEHAHVGCCGHHIEEEKNEPWAKRYLLHPLIHTLKIFLYILIINLIFGSIVYAIGEDNLTNFLSTSTYLAPLISVLVGLIPNCASSLVITQLFVKGGLTFGACLAGLCANAGLGLVILFKQNKNIKNNLTIVAILFISSLALGYLTQLIMSLL